MKKILSLLLTIVLIGTVVAAPVSAQSIGSSHLQTEEIADQVVPVAYTSDFAQQSNIVCVLNSDGTKTAYVFASAEDAAQVDSITGLTSPETMIRSNEGTNIAPANFEDATVYSGSPNTNYGDATTLELGATDNGYARTYIKLKDSTITSLRNAFSYKNLLGASLCLGRANNSDNLLGIYEIYMLKSNWSEDAITWSNRPDYYNDVLTMSNRYIIGYELQDFYITKALMGWMQGLPNHGLMLKEKDDQYLIKFHSTECGSTDFTLRPYLSITFTTDEVPVGQGVQDSESYYIVNRYTKQCLTASSSEYGSGIVLAYGSPGTSSKQKWTAIDTFGTYALRLENTNYYLCNNSTNGLFLGNFVGLPQDMWTIDRNWNGTYTLKSFLSSNGYLNSPLFGFVGTGSYTCDMNFNDEWSLVPASSGSATLMSMNSVADSDDFDPINTTYGMDTVSTQLLSRGYSQVDNLVHQPASRGFSELTSSNFFYFNQHGLPGKLLFYEGDTPSGGVGNTSEIVSSGEGEYSLSNLEPNALNRLRLALISACEAGANANLDGNTNGRNNDNMAGRLYWLGTHNVVSFFHRVGASAGSIIGTGTLWDSVFMTNTLLGRSLKNAKSRADRFVFQDLNANSIYVLGANERHDLGDDTYGICFDVENQQQIMQYRYRDIMRLSYARTEENASTVSLLLDAATLSSVTKQFTLPITKYNNINHNNSLDAPEIFDVYTDAMGGIYWYHAGTNHLFSYEPYTENIALVLGESVVDVNAAKTKTQTFLTQHGYNYSGFSVNTSNMYSKNFAVEYAKDDQKLVFHLQADSAGNVYILDFTAYNYTEV